MYYVLGGFGEKKAGKKKGEEANIKHVKQKLVKTSLNEPPNINGWRQTSNS